MSILEHSAPARPPTGNRIRWPLSTASRKAVLVTHIVAAGAWFGIDLVLCVLILAGLTRSPAGRDAVWRPLATFLLLPTIVTASVAGLICLASGLVLGLATKWGLLRYWWVAAKLVLNLVMTSILLAFLIGPFQEIAIGTAPIGDLSIVLYLSAIATLLVTVASVLSVYKPWGPLRRHG